METVCQAFITGVYQYPSESGSYRFGSGNYGDLAATVAAIILNRESQNEVLNADIMHGSLREPIILVTSLMRNFEYENLSLKSTESFVSLPLLQTKIGKANIVKKINFPHHCSRSLSWANFFCYSSYRANGL